MEGQRDTGEPTVGAAIAGLVEATAPGPERRELRAALSHVDAELGSLPLRDVSPRRVDELIDDLRAEGLSESREAAILDAVDELFDFARARPPADRDPIDGPEPQGTAVASPTPTATMLALGTHLASWTAAAIIVVFVVFLAVLLAELA